jgi:hypothetical protein
MTPQRTAAGIAAQPGRMSHFQLPPILKAPSSRFKTSSPVLLRFFSSASLHNPLFLRLSTISQAAMDDQENRPHPPHGRSLVGRQGRSTRKTLQQKRPANNENSIPQDEKSASVSTNAVQRKRTRLDHGLATPKPPRSSSRRLSCQASGRSSTHSTSQTVRPSQSPSPFLAESGYRPRKTFNIGLDIGTKFSKCALVYSLADVGNDGANSQPELIFGNDLAPQQSQQPKPTTLYYKENPLGPKESIPRYGIALDRFDPNDDVHTTKADRFLSQIKLLLDHTKHTADTRRDLCRKIRRVFPLQDSRTLERLKRCFPGKDFRNDLAAGMEKPEDTIPTALEDMVLYDYIKVLLDGCRYRMANDYDFTKRDRVRVTACIPSGWGQSSIQRMKTIFSNAMHHAGLASSPSEALQELQFIDEAQAVARYLCEHQAHIEDLKVSLALKNRTFPES